MFKLLVVFSDGLASKRCSSRAAVCAEGSTIDGSQTHRGIHATSGGRTRIDGLQNVDGDELVVDGDQLSLQRVAQA